MDVITFCQCGCGREAPLITANRPKRGEVAGSRRTFIKGHHGRRALIERIEEKCYSEPNTGCKLFVGASTNKGYGRILTPAGYMLVHRAVWEAANGPIPDGLHVMHKCDTPCCVELDHLKLGTRADNMYDMARKGRGTKGRLPRGVTVNGSGFSANIGIPGARKRKFLGYFKTVEEAAAVAAAARAELYGAKS